ncbi:MAG TPA: transcriptional repressor [Ignavibacteriaceae bacterium]|nr:transcriptional repressor [Ignavibacteriaceae bacterium]
MKKGNIGIELKNNNLKVTPQRIAVLEALTSLKDHPTADKIKEYVVKNHPNIAVGTIYKTLETFVEKGLVKKVKTDKDVMRYDAILDKHHHLYCEKSERIEDFFDETLNEMLEEYFKKKKIPNFKVKDIKLQIIGAFNNKKNN